MRSINLRQWDNTATAATFSVVPTIVGFDVVDDPTGHTVATAESEQEASSIVADLRDAARLGGSYLAAALGCPMDEDND